jgi:hypothetical protein
MECSYTLEDFARTYGALDRATFASTFTYPLLLVDLSGPRPRPNGIATRAPTSEIVNLEKGREPASARWVMPLVRSARSLVPDTITLGRASDNDLVVPHPSVSKVHAYFRKHPSAERYTIVDAGSSFGTTLNGKPVDRVSGLPLASGDTILLAKVVLSNFFLARDFLDYLHVLKRAEKSGIR